MSERTSFANRREAGQVLARAVKNLQLQDCVVIGLPRGGVPVAAEVARALSAPLDVIVVRKLGVPSQPELGFGAVSENGVRVINDEVVAAAGLDQLRIEEVAAAEQKNLKQRLEQIRAVHTEVPLQGKTVVIVDDGIATGIDARAACRVAKGRGAKSIVLAVPVAPIDWRSRLGKEADILVSVLEPGGFMAVGEFYEDFAPVETDEMLRFLNENS